MARPPPNRMLRGLSPASFTEEALPPAPVGLPPGFGIPLCAGVELSFLANLPPLGMKLAILEVLLFVSASRATGTTSSLCSSPLSSVLSGTEVRFATSFPFSFPFSLSFSGPLTEPFLVVKALLKVRWAMPLRAILGLLAVVETVVPEEGAAPQEFPLLVPLSPGRTLPSFSSKGSVLEPVSALSTCPAPSCLVGAALSVWGPTPLEEEMEDDLEPPLLLKSLSFSSIDF